MRSKSLLGCAWQPLGARNHCSGALRRHLAIEIAARAGFFVFDSTRQQCPSAAFSHKPLEITVRASSAATGRSKSPLGRASKPDSARNRCSSKLLCIRQHSKTWPLRYLVGTFRSTSLLGLARQPLGARKHGSDVLRSHLALEIAARASFMVFDSAFVILSRYLSKSLCFDLCIASSCALHDFTGAVKCAIYESGIQVAGIPRHTQTCGTFFVQVHINIWLVRNLDAGWLGGWRLASLLAGWLAGPAGLAGWLVGWLADWRTGWRAGRLAGWLVN